MANSRPPDHVRPILAGARQCPICGKPSVPRFQPFCSGRCADIDLGRWLKSTYRVETAEPAEEDPEAAER